MKIELDKKTDAAYIYLKESIDPGGVEKTYPCDPLQIKGMINLDFDKDGRLIGIEVMDASKKLPEEIIKNAEVIGED